MISLRGIYSLIDANGNVVVRYTYDSWGNITNISGSAAATIGAKNPYRYKGYYYDTETGLYYLQSRYYDPGIMRFINADERINENNLYVYCKNEPINRGNRNGYSCISFLKKRILKKARRKIKKIISAVKRMLRPALNSC